jgi:hypothetical protein
MIQIKDRAEFKEKLAFLMAANTSLIGAGAPATAETASTLIDSFLSQFEETKTDLKGLSLAGFVIIDRESFQIPFDFKEKLFPTQAKAVEALANYIKIRPYIKDGYGIRSVYS